MTMLRKILFYIALLVAGFAVGTLIARVTKARAAELAAAATASGEWKTLPTEAYPGKRDDISFVDAKHGWVATMAGGYYTADGGKSFTAVPIARAANKFRVVPGAKGKTVFAIGTQVQRLNASS